MPPIPKNNLRDRMIKLGYNPNIVTLTAPIVDNSKVKPPPPQIIKPLETFTPPAIVNIDEWSDFEDE